MMISAALLFAESDFTALNVLHEYIGFVGSFFIVGAASFYFLLMRPALGTNAAAMTAAARTAARIGCVGALLRLLALAMSVNSVMAAKHLSLGAVLEGSPASIVAEVMTVIAVIAFGLAATASRESTVAWMIAGIATLIVMLGALVTTKISRVVNPLHVFAASMWIGTLIVLVAAGVTTALGSTVESTARGRAVAMLVNRFSTIALWSAGLLVLTGVTTAYKHLGQLSALWTSIYGKTLIGKLCLVAVVFSLGYYNNRRLKPSLGTEEAGRRLVRSATLEIAIALQLFTSPVKSGDRGAERVAERGGRAGDESIGVLDTPGRRGGPGRLRAGRCPAGPINGGPSSTSLCLPRRPAVLHDIDLDTWGPARRVAVVGETGSGKPPLAKLLTRLMDPTRGECCARRRRPASGRVRLPARARRLVPQEGFLFEGRWLENSRFGRPEATTRRSRLARDELGLDDWPDGLPRGGWAPRSDSGGSPCPRGSVSSSP